MKQIERIARNICEAMGIDSRDEIKAVQIGLWHGIGMAMDEIENIKEFETHSYLFALQYLRGRLQEDAPQ